MTIPSMAPESGLANNFRLGLPLWLLKVEVGTSTIGNLRKAQGWHKGEKRLAFFPSLGLSTKYGILGTEGA